MDKTLLAILEEGAVKLNTRPLTKTISDPNQSTIFITSISLEIKGDKIEAVARSARKQVSKHLAAGELLLRILDTPYWDRFPFKLPHADEAKIAVQQQMESYNEEGTTVSTNPVGNLQNLCKQNSYPDPSYDYEECDGNPRMFTVECSVPIGPNLKSVKAIATSKKQAKANAAKEMLDILRNGSISIKTSPVKEAEEYHETSSFHVISPSENLKISQSSSKKNISSLIKNAFDKPHENSKSYYYVVTQLEKTGFLKDLYKKAIITHLITHKSSDPRKKLCSLHILDKIAYEKMKSLNFQTMVHSFIGIGENDECAKNEAARNLLSHIKVYWECDDE